MERIGLEHFTASLRASLINGAANGADDDLPAEQRPNRSDRTDLGALKDDDDVMLWGFQVARVVCPGRGLGAFYALVVSDVTGQPQLATFEAANVTDRAPADPEETPMPIFPEEPTP